VKRKRDLRAELIGGRALYHASLGLRNALGVAKAGITMMDNQIIIGEGREREREGQEIGRSIDPEQPGGRESRPSLGP
tara:strand:- start:175 stop:408 length:234 start_codon:yes stop_codon:yes gene_type:complete